MSTRPARPGANIALRSRKRGRNGASLPAADAAATPEGCGPPDRAAVRPARLRCAGGPMSRSRPPILPEASGCRRPRTAHGTRSTGRPPLRCGRAMRRGSRGRNESGTTRATARRDGRRSGLRRAAGRSVRRQRAASRAGLCGRSSRPPSPSPPPTDGPDALRCSVRISSGLSPSIA